MNTRHCVVRLWLRNHRSCLANSVTNTMFRIEPDRSQGNRFPIHAILLHPAGQGQRPAKLRPVHTAATLRHDPEIIDFGSSINLFFCCELDRLYAILVSLLGRCHCFFASPECDADLIQMKFTGVIHGPAELTQGRIVGQIDQGDLQIRVGPTDERCSVHSIGCQ